MQSTPSVVKSGTTIAMCPARDAARCHIVSAMSSVVCAVVAVIRIEFVGRPRSLHIATANVAMAVVHVVHEPFADMV